MSSNAATETRIKTGSSEFDKMLNGGFLPGSAVLVEGAAGTGKTTLGCQFLMEGMKKGEAGLIVTFEEFPEQYYDCALELGWDLRAMENEGLLEVIFTTPSEFADMVNEDESPLVQIIEDKGIKRALLDSVTNLEKLAGDIGDLRKLETDVVNFFKREELTTLLLKENRNILGGWDISANKIPFIVDCYVIMRYLEMKSEIKRGLMILKMRGSNHEKEIREYVIKENGLDIGSQFDGVSGIFTGLTVATGKGK